MEKPKRKGKPKDEPYPDWRWIRTIAIILFVIFGIPLIGLVIFARALPHNLESANLLSPSETVTVLFNNIAPTYTQKNYSGIVTLNISGMGQAGGTDWSDAFYLYAHNDGTPYDPPITEHFDLEIDGQRAIITLGLQENPPPYSPDHVYTVRYDVGTEARLIAFRISDSIVGDNTGEFSIEVRNEQ